MKYCGIAKFASRFQDRRALPGPAQRVRCAPGRVPRLRGVPGELPRDGRAREAGLPRRGRGRRGRGAGGPDAASWPRAAART